MLSSPESARACATIHGAVATAAPAARACLNRVRRVNARAARRVGVDSGDLPFIHAFPALATIPVPKSQTHDAGKKGARIVASPPDNRPRSRRARAGPGEAERWLRRGRPDDAYVTDRVRPATFLPSDEGQQVGVDGRGLGRGHAV